MLNVSLQTRRRLLAVTAVAGLAASATLSATAAHAGATPTNVKGQTVVVIGGKAVKTLTTNGCGDLSATGINGAQIVQTATNQWRMTFKISGLATNDNGGLIIAHSGGVQLTNNCYAISLTNLKITNFGQAGQFTSLDLNGVTHSGDDTGRQVVGELDLTNAVITPVTGNKVRVTKVDLLLASEGAQEFNELATGFATGPFTTGEKVGNARTTATFSG